MPPPSVDEPVQPHTERRWALLLGVPTAVLVVAALVPLTLLALAAQAAALVVEQLLPGRAPQLVAWLRRAQTGSGIRCGQRLLLVGVALAQDPELGPGAAAVLLLAGGTLFATRSAWFYVVRATRRYLRDYPRWLGVEVAGTPQGPDLPPPPGFLARTPTQDSAVLRLEWLLLAGALLGALTGDARWLVALAAAAVVLAGVFVTRAVLSAVRSHRLPARAAAVAAVADGVAALAPEVVVYFSSPASGSYALRVWLDVLRALPRPPLVLMREAHHLEALDLHGLPAVVLPRADDVEQVQTPSVRVALYPTNVVRNNHMIRLVGIRHAFIGHGDSDKAGSFSPITRVYDEIWVAGPAGRDRYLAVSEGIREEQIHCVGRPQLARLRRGRRSSAERADLTTVLYAPTWEGFYPASDYCSLPEVGLEAVRRLTATPGVRLLFKPHPASGQRRADVTAAIAEIEDLLAAEPHALVPAGPESLYESMDEADVLLTDVSSVLSDWLATGRPYLVTNPLHLDADEFRSRFPTAGGGAVVQDGAEVVPLVLEAVGVDARAGDRVRLAEYLLGPPREDPVGDFVAEVARFVAGDPARPAVHR